MHLEYATLTTTRNSLLVKVNCYSISRPHASGNKTKILKLGYLPNCEFNRAH